jgi:hypothetical protein
MGIVFTVNYYFSGRRRPINNETLLMIDFVNLKIKSTQSFKCSHKNRVYIHVFIGVNTHIYIYIYISICVYVVKYNRQLESIARI